MALFLARRGFRVVAVDVVDEALAELRSAAAAEGLPIETEHADIAAFPLTGTYGNVVCTYTLHFLAPEEAAGLDDWEVVHDGRRIVETAARDEPGRPSRQPADELVARKPVAGA